MDWESYERLGPGTAFEDKPGRTSGGSGWHWNTVHKEPARQPTRDEQRAARAAELAAYPLPPEAEVQPGVPRGLVTAHEAYECRAFAETQRDYWVYVPAQYVPGSAAKLILCFDGDGYLDPAGEIRVAAVLDNMIHAGEIEPTVAVFVRPGKPLSDIARGEKTVDTDWERSYEYDSITSKNGGFLQAELLPRVEQQHGVRFSTDPADRLLMGHSSGGVAAMAAGFHHPEAFGNVVSHCASYVNIRGGHQLPWVVRNTPRKEGLKVLLLIGTNDNDNDHGNNQLGNEQLGAALEYAGYDSALVIGDGFHNKVHGAHVFPDTLRWMWAGGPKPEVHASFTRSAAGGAHAKL
eukprot:SAG22_NODE_273_length_13182_cov_12.693419_4_plen_349_part_00